MYADDSVIPYLTVGDSPHASFLVKFTKFLRKFYQLYLLFYSLGHERFAGLGLF